MNREKFKKEFVNELTLFHMVSKTDLEKGLISVLDYMGKFIENA